MSIPEYSLFQLFNYLILPSTTLARLVNIYMFRCNNKLLFVTSSFVGWLIGHILFMKGARLVSVQIQQNYSIRSMYLFGRINVEIEITSKTEETKPQEEGFIKDNPSPSLFRMKRWIQTKSMNGKNPSEWKGQNKG
ncbi:hypothetical protein RDABS01_032128 [Bienertia sinuspersici]